MQKETIELLLEEVRTLTLAPQRTQKEQIALLLLLLARYEQLLST